MSRTIFATGIGRKVNTLHQFRLLLKNILYYKCYVFHDIIMLCQLSLINIASKMARLGQRVRKMAGAINYVWNYCQEVSLLAFRRNKTFLSAYNLHQLTTGTSKDLRLSADTIQKVCTEYVTRRKQFKKIKLKWRSKKRSLGWIPFKVACVNLAGDTVTYCGRRFRLWLSRPVEWSY